MAKTSIYKTDEGKKRVLSYYETLLLQWYQPSKQLIIETTFGETFIVESGDKNYPAIILLHGSSSNSAMWIADVKELSRNYHVFAIDIIGECGKSSENRRLFKDDNYSNWILEIVNILELNSFSIIACSLGAWIAIEFAINYPRKTERLVLIATAGVTQVKLGTVLLIIITSLMGFWGFNKLNKMVYGKINFNSEVLEFASLVKKFYKPRAGILPIFSNESLRQIKSPTLFIGGEYDCFYNSQKTALRLNKNVENIQCVLLKNTNHVLINQTDRIIRFLK